VLVVNKTFMELVTSGVSARNATSVIRMTEKNDKVRFIVAKKFFHKLLSNNYGRREPYTIRELYHICNAEFNKIWIMKMVKLMENKGLVVIDKTGRDFYIVFKPEAYNHMEQVKNLDWWYSE